MLQNPKPQTLTKKFKKLINYLFTRGTSTFILILGRRESGKTDMALLISEILYSSNTFKMFASNVKLEKPPFRFDYIINLPDLETWAASSKGHKLFILDEAGKAFRRRTPMSKLNIELIDKLQTLRKYQLSFIFIAPHEKYIDGAGLGSDVLDGVFIKPYFRNPKVALYEDKLEGFDFMVKSLPPTSLDFDTWDVAPFNLKRQKPDPANSGEDYNILWEFSHGRTIKDLKVHPQEINRIMRKFVKDTLESQPHTSHP